jgi:hypothetical protein
VPNRHLELADVPTLPPVGDALGRCLSVRQLARYWRCAPARIRQMIRRGLLEAFLIGRAVRISPDAIREAERQFAAPVSGGRRKRSRNDGIAREVIELLDRDD